MAQGVLGLVLNTLKRSGELKGLPPPLTARILAPLRILRPQAMLWSIERDRVVALLRGGGVDPVVLKGGALREMVYDDPSDRPVGDLDLLVSSAELEQAMRLLEEAGYSLPADQTEVERFRTTHFHFPLINTNGFEVELHWGLGQPSFQWSLDPAGFVSRSTPTTAGNLTLRVPCAEDMLLHLCTQNVEDSFSKLRRLVDIDRLAARYPINWETVVQRAREGGTEVIVGLSLQLANRLLGAGLPSEVINDLVPSRTTRFHLAALHPEGGILGTSAPRRAVSEMALSLWLSTPRNRVKQLRNIVEGSDQIRRSGESGGWAKGRRAVVLSVFHIVLWARGLLFNDKATKSAAFWAAA